MLDKVLGIDLGTSNSCVAIMKDGQPYVIPDRHGNLIQPSIVNFQEDGRILVGAEAKPFAIAQAENTIYSSKRLIGRKVFSAEVKKARALMPYKISEGGNKSAVVEVLGNEYTLQEISAMILTKMKAIAEAHLGESISRAVITVPAYFNDNQRAATKDAGKIAGLDVLRIINEPTAAALAYGYGQDIRQRVALYDLGGGTFDISILELGDGIFEVVSTSGDTYLGGDDFDERIIEYLSSEFQKQHGIDLNLDRMALQKLKDAAENAKKTLTKETQAKIFIPGVCNDKSKGFLDLDVTLNRENFNQMVMDLVQKTFKVCDEALHLAQMTASDMEGIVLVGGPTRMPIIRESVERYFQKISHADIDPDQVVAIGAAIQGSALIGQTKDVVLVDLTPLSLGIEIRGNLVDRIVDINTPVPVEHTKIFSTSSDNQDSVNIRVFQGEERKSSDNELLGEFSLQGLRPAPAGEVSIAVAFEIDTDGILNVTARDVETGNSHSVRMQACGRLNEEELRQAQGATQAVE